MRLAVYDGHVGRELGQHPYEMIEDGPPATVSEVLDWGAAHGIDGVWLAESTDLDTAIARPGFWNVSTTVVVDRTPRSARHDDPSVVVCRSDDDRWGLSSRRIGELGNTLEALQHLLGVAPLHSPASTGLQLLRRDLRSRGWLEPSPWAALPVPHIVTRDIGYVRQDLRPPRWLHLVDRNGAYLHAARSSDFGAGVPVAAPSRDAWSTAMGLWHIREWSIPPLNAHLVPLPTRGHDAWVVTPVLIWLDELNCRFRVTERITWPDRHRLLRPWAERVLSVRRPPRGLVEEGRISEPALGNLREAGKRIGNLTIGMLGHASVGTVPQWYRPEWRAQIVAINAMTFARQIRRIEAAGFTVYGAYTDALAVGSDHAEPPELVGFGEGLGQYRYQHSLGATAAARLVSAAGDLSPAQWFGELRRES
jgi:hypothetical protein